MKPRKKSKQRRRWSAKAAKALAPKSGDVKMSEVILKLAEPLWKQFPDDEKRIRTIISLTIIQWNKLMQPDGEQEKVEQMMTDRLVPQGGNAELVDTLVYISGLIRERKERFYPDLRNIITGHNLDVTGGRITLNVSFVDIDDDEGGVTTGH